jgi:hypothetical protein
MPMRLLLTRFSGRVKHRVPTKHVLLMSVLAASIGTLACSRVQQAQTKVQRVALERQQREYKSPVNYAPREIGSDPKTGKPIAYDHKPRVELIDAKAGKYLLKWIGYDHKEKSVVYQRGDAIDVIVRAASLRTADGRYTYTYDADNLPSSGSYLSHLILQSFASDVQAIEIDGRLTKSKEVRGLETAVSIGEMSNVIPEFKDGKWISIAPLSTYKPQVTAGRTFEVKLSSSAPPGLVECRVTGGQLTLDGVDEDMPAVLEDLIPGYEQFPHGYTIGPVEYLKNLSPSEKTKYLLDRLPMFKKAGWITDQALQRYEAPLKSGSLEPILIHAEEDLKTEQITTEVFAIIQGFR